MGFWWITEFIPLVLFSYSFNACVGSCCNIQLFVIVFRFEMVSYFLSGYDHQFLV